MGMVRKKMAILHRSYVMSNTLKKEWTEILKNFPPLLTPKQTEQATSKIISRRDVYQQNLTYKRQLALDVRRIGGRLFVTRQSLLNVLCGGQELPL